MQGIRDFHQKKELFLCCCRKLKLLRDSIAQETNSTIVDDSSFNRIESQLHDDKFIIAVVGIIKRGKSTLLNALLEADEEILPTDVIPETARLSFLQYGTDKHAIVHMNSGEMRRVSFSELKSYTSARSEGIRDAQFAEIYYPNKYLENDVVIVDTPGVDDPDPSRSEVTEGFIAKADAAIFLIDVTEGGLKEFELGFMRSRLLNTGDQKGIVVVMNKIGALRRRQVAELPKMISDTKEFLCREFQMDIPVFGIDAKYAWEGAQKKDAQLMEASRFSPFTSALEEMLIENKGRILLNKRCAALRFDIVKPLREFLSFEVNTKSDKVDELADELHRLTAELAQKETVYLALKVEYESKLDRLCTVVENEIHERVSRINPESGDTLNKVVSDAFLGFAECNREKAKKLIDSYVGELGCASIKIPELEFSFACPDIDVSGCYSERTETYFSSLKGQYIAFGFLVGNLLGAAIGTIAGIFGGCKTRVVRTIDHQKFGELMKQMKSKMVESHTQGIKDYFSACNGVIDRWFNQERMSQENRTTALDRKRLQAQEEHAQYIQRMRRLLTELDSCDAEIKQALDDIRSFK